VIVRQSQFPVPVLRHPPPGIDRLTATAVRGGYLRITSQGVVWLPLGTRLIERLRTVLSAGQFGKILAPTAVSPSPILELLRAERPAARDLPRVMFAEWGPAGGPARGLKDSDAFGVLEWGAAAADLRQAEAALAEHEQSLLAALGRCGLRIQRMSDGQIGQGGAFLTAEGPSLFLRCAGCGYLAERDAAIFALAPALKLSPAPVVEVPTPGASTIKILCEQLGIEPSATLKALFLTAKGETMLALLRGDLEASLVKLRRAIGAEEVRPATPKEIDGLGVVAGYAGPVGLRVRSERGGQGVWVIADRSVVASPNLVTGANRDGVHLTGVNYPRDFTVTESFDFARAPRGATCADCGADLVEERGVVLVRRRTFEGGFAFASGDAGPNAGAIVSLQLSLGAVAAAVMTAARQEAGMRFPAACAPFHVHVIELAGGADFGAATEELARHNLDVLVDDRDLSAGVKFAEAEWIGAPLQIVAGRKSLEAGGVELRSAVEETRIVGLTDLASVVLGAIGEVM
jgi:prolyl-tRNA synthetase